METRNLNLRALATGVGIGLFGRFLGRIIAVVSGAIAARVLGPTSFGLYAIGLTFVRLGEVILPLGLDIGVIRYGVKLSEDKRRLRGLVLYSIWVAFMFGVLVGLIIFLNSTYLSHKIFNQPQLDVVLKYVSILIPFVAVLVVASSATRISHDVKYSLATQDVGQPLVALILLVYFSWQGWNLNGVLLADLISIVLSAVCALFFLGRLFPSLFTVQPDIVAPDRNYYSFSIVSSFSVIFSTLVFWVDRLILGMYLPPHEVGIYQAAAQLSVVFAVILGGMNRIITPLFSGLYSAGSYRELNEVYSIGTKWALYLGVPIFIVIFLHPQSVITGIYGGQYESGVAVLYILLVGQFVNLITGSIAPLLNVAGYQTGLMLFSGVSLGVSVLLNLALVPLYGIAGAAISTSVSLVIYYAVSLFYARAKLRIWPFDKRYIKVGVAALISLSLGYLSARAIDNISVAYIGAELVITYCLFYMVFWVAGFDQEDQIFLSSLKQYFKFGVSN